MDDLIERMRQCRERVYHREAEELLALAIDRIEQLTRGGREMQRERDGLAQELDTVRAAWRMCERSNDSLRSVLEWYADEKNWIEATLLMGESEEYGEITGSIIARSSTPGRFGLAPNCKCGQCYDHWYADNGERARAALAGRGDNGPARL